MTIRLRRCTVIFQLLSVLSLLFAACGGSTPTWPTRVSQPAPSAGPSPAPSPPKTFPPLSGPSRTFVFDHELEYGVHSATKNSRFVLYDNGAFVLQYPDLGEVGYRGGYTETNGVVTFDWEGWSTAGAWGATGTLAPNGQLLTVRYNEIMLYTDFEDAAYALASKSSG